MSTTYSLACIDCKIKIWIGQGYDGYKKKDIHLYHGVKGFNELLKITFLITFSF